VIASALLWVLVRRDRAAIHLPQMDDERVAWLGTLDEERSRSVIGALPAPCPRGIGASGIDCGGDYVIGLLRLCHRFCKHAARLFQLSPEPLSSNWSMISCRKRKFVRFR